MLVAAFEGGLADYGPQVSVEGLADYWPQFSAAGCRGFRHAS